MKEFLFPLKRGVILACDVNSLLKLEEIVKLTQGVEGMTGYKIGFSLSLRFGLREAVKTVKRHTDLPVIYDHQKAGTDVPYMAEPFAELCKEAYLDGVILFPLSGPKTMESFVDALNKNGLKPIVGGEMTHPRYLKSEGGYIKDEAPSEIYVKAAKLGVNHFIIPGNKPSKINYYSDLLRKTVSKPVFCMPGIGRQGGDVSSAFKAASGVSTHAIIGSAIYKAENIREAAKRLCDEALRVP